MRKNILAIQMSAVSADFDTNCEKVTSLFDDFTQKQVFAVFKRKTGPILFFFPKYGLLAGIRNVFKSVL